MRVLGISAEYHDASAALVENESVIASAAEERFTRIKHDSSFPSCAIEFCLEQGGIPAQDLDAIVFYEQPSLKFTRVLASTLSEFPHSGRDFIRATRRWLGNRLWTQNQISKILNVHPNKIEFVSHHSSHAAQAFLQSGFKEAAILTIDAVGEWACTAIAHGIQHGNERIRTLETFSYPHSIGLVYTAFTAYLGFKPNDAECSTMALAAFGRPRFADSVRRILRQQSDGSYEVDPTYFRFLSNDRDLYTSKFIGLFGEPRDPRQSIPFQCRGEISAEEARPCQRFADIAASVQLVCEEVLLGLARRAHYLTGARVLCFAGGVAMNAVANSRLIEETPFDEIFIPPDPGDGGAAAGAGLLWNSGNGGEPCGPVSPYLGKAYSVGPVVDMLDHLALSHHRQHQMLGCRPLASSLEVVCYKEERTFIDRVVQDLLEGRIVGWFQGRFENGPRALGNRSLLVDPANAQTVARLSHRVKQRAAFRPYALSIAESDSHRLFDWPRGLPGPSRLMQMVAHVDERKIEEVRCALHIDLTTRPQICSLSDNARFNAVLTGFGEARGLAALINTSFNEAGYPMVASPMEALLSFLRTDIDTLVMNDTIVRKPL